MPKLPPIIVQPLFHAYTVLQRCLDSPMGEDASEKQRQSLLEEITNGCDSSQDDSAVSFEQSILDEHLFCVRLHVRRLTNYLFKNIGYENLIALIQPQCDQRPPLREYLSGGESLLGQEGTAFYIQTLRHQYNLCRFLSEVLESSPEMVVHELLLVAFRVLKHFPHNQNIFYTISELRSLSSSLCFIKLVCHDQQLKMLSYQLALGETDPCDASLSFKLLAFLRFYIFTVLLVRQNYFINPYYKRILLKRKERRRCRGVTRHTRRANRKCSPELFRKEQIEK